MRRILVIGMGAGDPDQLTIQAINAMRTTDVFFVIDKGTEKNDLLQARQHIFARHLQGHPARIIEIEEVCRDRSPPDYLETVDAWHEARRQSYESHICGNLQSHECGAFLVWGDPSLYDSTIRILDKIVAAGTLPLNYDVIPGISSVQVLAARHRITLNQIGESITVTTGRKLAMMPVLPTPDTVVLLDGQCAFTRIAEKNIHIYWGAYLGTTDEILIAGELSKVAAQIEQTRTEARLRKGWIMDTYLLRKTS